MKTLFLSILLYLLTGARAICQIDTSLISNTVRNLRTIEDHRSFWKEIYYNDQHYRGKLANINNDHKNLLAVSFYINLYGYPDVKVIGRESDIASMVWKHTKSMQIRKLTFPIIHEAFKKKLITVTDLRKYFILGLYNRILSDNGNETRPLSQLFQELDLNTSSSINLNQLVEEINKYNVFLNSPKEFIGNWVQVYSSAEPLYFNAAPYLSCGKGDTLLIYKLNDIKYYLEIKYSDKSFDPVDLQIKNHEKNILQYKYKESSCYYEIGFDDNLYLKNENGIVIEKYHRINRQ